MAKTRVKRALQLMTLIRSREVSRACESAAEYVIWA